MRFVLISMGMVLCSCFGELPHHTEFVKGMSASQILTRFGQPNMKELMQTNIPFDYIETNSSTPDAQIEPEFIEVWRYRSINDSDPPWTDNSKGIGTSLLFFSNEFESDNVVRTTGWMSAESLESLESLNSAIDT